MFKRSKRINKVACGVAIMVVSASTLTADVTLDFNYTGSVLNGLQPLQLNFSVNGVGNVTLDANTLNAGASAAITNAVNAWDGAVGTVSEASLFGTSFTLLGGTGGPGLAVGQQDTGVLGISGQAAARIDQSGTETLTFNASGLGAGVVLDIQTMSYGNRAANGASNVKVVDADSSYDQLIPNTSTFGTIDLTGLGFAIGSGEGLGFTTTDSGVAGAGYGLAGFTFDAVVIPEPTTMSLIGLGGLAVFVRRRLAS